MIYGGRTCIFKHVSSCIVTIVIFETGFNGTNFLQLRTILNEVSGSSPNKIIVSREHRLFYSHLYLEITHTFLLHEHSHGRSHKGMLEDLCRKVREVPETNKEGSTRPITHLDKIVGKSSWQAELSKSPYFLSTTNKTTNNIRKGFPCVIST